MWIIYLYVKYSKLLLFRYKEMDAKLVTEAR